MGIDNLIENTPFFLAWTSSDWHFGEDNRELGELVLEGTIDPLLMTTAKRMIGSDASDEQVLRLATELTTFHYFGEGKDIAPHLVQYLKANSKVPEHMVQYGLKQAYIPHPKLTGKTLPEVGIAEADHPFLLGLTYNKEMIGFTTFASNDPGIFIGQYQGIHDEMSERHEMLHPFHWTKALTHYLLNWAHGQSIPQAVIVSSKNQAHGRHNPQAGALYDGTATRMKWRGNKFSKNEDGNYVLNLKK